jgi:hypothetical protein
MLGVVGEGCRPEGNDRETIEMERLTSPGKRGGGREQRPSLPAAAPRLMRDVGNPSDEPSRNRNYAIVMLQRDALLPLASGPNGEGAYDFRFRWRESCSPEVSMLSAFP